MCGSGDNSLGERQGRRVEPCIRTRGVQDSPVRDTTMEVRAGEGYI